jgi:plastocyanin
LQEGSCAKKKPVNWPIFWLSALNHRSTAKRIPMNQSYIASANHKEKRILRGLLTLAATIALVLVAAGPWSIASASTVEVKMKDTPPVYVPEKVTVKVGDTVEWDNNAASLHTVTADPSKAADQKDVELPPGAQPFDSGFMMPDGKFSYTFTKPGTYKYVCLPHEKDGMIGYVIVTK